MSDNTMHRINIVGHQNPDTDSICSAIAYAWLKNHGKLEGEYEARRAGNVNRETQFVLDHFGMEAPRLCTDLSPQIKDIDIRYQEGIDGEMSLKRAWNLMRDSDIDTLCITDADGMMEGLITIKDIANANMELFDTGILAAANTKYANLIDTLDAVLLQGDVNGVISGGKVCIGTSPEIMEELLNAGDLVLGTNRYDTQLCAIEMGAKAMVVCCNANVSDDILKLAKEKGCDIIVTPYDTYGAARLVTTAAPVRHFMKTGELMSFSLDTSVEDAGKIMANVRYRYFPVTDASGRYVGVFSRRNLLNLRQKQVILVDHNEKSQAVEGLDKADILEIIDHHKIGSIETNGPVYFRNEPVGCTATIIYRMYKEQGVKPSDKIAGLLLSAILSDTLMFRSPTSTVLDKDTAEELADIAGVYIPEYAEQMFEAGADLTGRDADDVFKSDFKTFSKGDLKFGAGQSIYMTDNSRLAAEELVRPYLPEASQKEGVPVIFYMFTDMKTQDTDLMIYGDGGEEIIKEAFGVEVKDGIALLKGVVSRKKQLIPPILSAIQEIQNR